MGSLNLNEMENISLSEFEMEYSVEIAEFKKETGRYVIWDNRITGQFKKWLHHKHSKTILNNPFNHITEFFSEFIKKHKYFTRKHLVDDFIHTDNTPKNKLVNVELEFKSILRFNVKNGVLEKYSKKTYKRVN